MKIKASPENYQKYEESNIIPTQAVFNKNSYPNLSQILLEDITLSEGGIMIEDIE